jgi:hypothetical protein
MAARSVRLRYTIAAVVLTLLAAWATYHLKYAVRDREIELDHLRAQVDTSRKAMQLQRADLAYLTRPERLVVQAGQLNMTPGRGARLVDVSQIVPAAQLQLALSPLPALLPSGAATVLQLRPIPAIIPTALGRTR